MTEPELLEAMHTQAAPVAPDGDDYTYARLPALVRREELDAAKAENSQLRQHLEAARQFSAIWRNHAETHECMWREAEELRQKEGQEAAAELAELRAALAAATARAEAAEHEAAALRASTEAAAVVYLRSEVDQLRAALAAASARAEAAEAAIDAMDDYLNYRDQSIAENCRPRSFIEWWRIRQMAQKVQP